MAALPHPRALARIDPRKNHDLTDDIFLGALAVDLVRAELPKCDANGSCDPYVVISMGNQTFKTKKQMKTRTPTWDLSFRFNVKSKKDSLHIECFDWDRFTKNDLIGTVDVPCENFLPPSLKDLMGDHDTGRSRDIGVKDQMWLTLKKKGKRRGRILLKLKFDEGLNGSETLSKGVPALDINPAFERASESDYAESDAEIEELNITIENTHDLDNGAPREEECF